MRAFFYSCLATAGLLASVKPTQAQTIADLNLDTWAVRNGVEAPTNWLTTDDDIAFQSGAAAGTYNFGTATKTTDRHGGTYAAKLTTTTVTIGTSSGPVPGELILGSKPGKYTYLGYAIGGVPLAARPAQMQCYYKLTSTTPAADSALAVVYLTKTTNGVPSIIGRGYQFLLAATASYTQLTVPITYSTTNTATPDSIHIVFTSGFADNVTAGTSLYVDDVTVSGVNLATHVEADIDNKLTVSPNPSTGGHFTIHSAAMPELAASPLVVYDRVGRVVVRQATQATLTGERELDLSSMQAGFYLLRLDSKQGPIIRQLTVQ